MPDVLIDTIKSMPGYTVICTVIGSDPITGEPATAARQGLVEALLTYGPFGAASGRSCRRERARRRLHAARPRPGGTT